MQGNTNAQQDLSGLDFDFLRYMDVRPEVQRKIQEFYLPHYEQCSNVVDLGCGDGDFVRLLLEHDIPAMGVDSDAKAHAVAARQDLPVVLDDVFHYLDTLPGDSVDGIFCAHLVEHLPYAEVVDLVRLSFRALAPGGVIVLATPDVRSLFSHLEMFYLHFGHVSFYHPRLLCFFLEHAGFTNAEFDTNPATASPLMPELDRLANTRSIAPEHAPVSYRREIPPQGTSLLHRASYALKRRLTRWLIHPLLDDLTHSVNQEMDRTRSELSADLRTLAAALQSLNGPFECYAVAHKPHTPSASYDASQTST
jgi:SAM-dependent methyltransferase